MSHLANDIFDPRRYGLITGSGCSVMFPKKKVDKPTVGMMSYAKQLANQFHFKYYDETGTWQTEHGHLVQPVALEEIRDKRGYKEAHEPEFMCDGDWGGTADCVLNEDDGADIKAPTTLGKWLSYLHDGIDDEQFHQCQMYMFLYGRKRWYIIAHLMETSKMSENGLTYPVPYDKRQIWVPVDREPTWEDELRKTTPWVVGLRDFYIEKLKQHFT